MKKITLYSILLFFFLFSSCKKFLEERSQDEIRPGTTTDLNALMYSDAYPYKTATDNFDLLTDDIQSNGLAVAASGAVPPGWSAAFDNGRAMFTFDPTMFDSNNAIASSADVYNIYYTKIKGCNVVMDQLKGVSGTDQEKNAILGQCLFLRSYYFLKLVMTYGKPYNAQGVDPAISLGVPLVLTSAVHDGTLARNTLKEVYDQIEKDLISAAALLKDNFVPSSSFRVGSTAAYTLLSRFYLYRGLNSDWDKSISYANLALAQNSNLTKFTTFITSTNTIVNTGVYAATNPEVIWVFGNNPNSDETYFPALSSTLLPPYTVSASLGSSYTRVNTTTNYGDIRYRVYFTSASFGPYKSQKAPVTAAYGAKGLRVAELYLNRAESYLQRGMLSGNTADFTLALADLNTLRASRFDTRSTPYTPVTINDPAALYKFCQDERRRELCLEDGHRWSDIKRWGLSVTHVFTNADGTSITSTLAMGSNLYALPIPYTAINNNPGLVQNPR